GHVLRMLSSGRRRVTRNDQIAISGSLLAGAASFVQRLIAGHGDVAEPLTTLGLLPKLSTLWRGPGSSTLQSGLGRVIQTKQTVHIIDITADQGYTEDAADSPLCAWASTVEPGRLDAAWRASVSNRLTLDLKPDTILADGQRCRNVLGGYAFEDWGGS